MNLEVFTVEQSRFSKITIGCFLLLFVCAGNLFAQYKGAPVKKARLIQALRSRQLQSRDIVTIIRTNGVDFRLTPETRRALISAGARPEVIQAVSSNPRLQLQNRSEIAKVNKNKSIRKAKPATPDYDDLLEQAIYSYRERRNPQDAVRLLTNAARIEQSNPAAYQMLGFVQLYGLNNFTQAEKAMRESVTNGGSAVFRVFHDDNGKFTKRCTGSLFISKDAIRFESDDNQHTFETSGVNVDKIKLDTETTRSWKKHSIFKIFLKIGSEKAKFRFAPLTGALEESKMVERFISTSNANQNFAGLILPTLE